MVITRLGEGVDESGLLLPEAVERTIAALEGYRDVMGPLEPTGVAAAATAVLRNCDNAGEFLDRAEGIIGTRPRVLSGEEEAMTSFLGAVSDLADEAAGVEGPVFVFDIGGGSTELIVGDLAAAADGAPPESLSMRSVDVGCLRMSERFLKTDPPSPVSIGRMESHIVQKLKPAVSSLLGGRPALAVGLAGTVTTLSGIKLGLEEYDTDRIHHSKLTRDDVEEIFKRLASVTLGERKKIMGLEPGRADVIVGGAGVLRVVMDLAGLDEILVSEKDILDGLVLDLYRSLATT
jgi:exopolyphosphatase/guanosine-5'-triphosphate,3'-diphosphate pyrophosphatase